MKRIRLGKDIVVTFQVLTNDTEQSLEGRDLQLEIKLPNGTIHPVDNYTITGNTVNIRIPGRFQRVPGTYGFILWENRHQQMQTVCDINNAFQLVTNTSKEN